MYSMWKYGIDEKKKAKQLKKNPEKKNPGKVFRIFSVTETIDEAINNFLKLIPKLKDHIVSGMLMLSTGKIYATIQSLPLRITSKT